MAEPLEMREREYGDDFLVSLTGAEILLISRTCRWAAGVLGGQPGHEGCGLPIAEVNLKLLRQTEEQIEARRKPCSEKK